MIKNKRIIIFATVVIAFTALSGALSLMGKAEPTNPTLLNRMPKISPDYHNTVVPFNIAPLNFTIKEKADNYFVRVSTASDSFDIYCKNSDVIIPMKKWKSLLVANKGKKINFEVFTLSNDRWRKYKSITNKIADEPIDSYLCYRRIPPVRVYIDTSIGIYQRNLTNYSEKLILSNDYYYGGCLNCHNFAGGDSRVMSMGIRSKKLGDSTLFIDGDKVQNVDLKIGYNSWHPSKKLVVYSVNKVVQFVNTAGKEFREVFDLDSMLAYYIRRERKVKTADVISSKDRQETYPCFSPDGKYLYFCSAPMLWHDEKQLPPPRYKEMKYDIVRVSYDVENDKWGQLETIIPASLTGKSNLLPRISPDGRWLVFCTTNYGCFPSHSPSSDLWIADLNAETIKPRQLKINSEQSESWHSFSSNNSWIVFSTKRRNGTFTRTYMAYLDGQGNVSKPFLLPVKDPKYFDTCRDGFTVPEFTTNAAKLTGEKLGRIIRSAQKTAVTLPITMATPTQTKHQRYDSAE